MEKRLLCVYILHTKVLELRFVLTSFERIGLHVFASKFLHSFLTNVKVAYILKLSFSSEK